jgi:hypothetical protein
MLEQTCNSNTPTPTNNLSTSIRMADSSDDHTPTTTSPVEDDHSTSSTESAGEGRNAIVIRSSKPTKKLGGRRFGDGRRRRLEIQKFISDTSKIKVQEDVTAVLKALKTRFSKQKWPPTDPRRQFHQIDIFLDYLSGGHNAELLTSYLRSAVNKNGGGSESHSVRHALYGTVMAELGEQSKLLGNIKETLSACSDSRTELKGQEAQPKVTNAIRMCLLKILQGVVPRNVLRDNGFKFSNDTWKKALNHFEDDGFDLWFQSSAGRADIPADLRNSIQDFVMTDEWTKILPSREDCKTEEPRALTHTVEEIYRDFPEKHRLHLSKFRTLVSGSKDSATPTLRKWLHETDRCDKCPARRAAIATMKQYIETAETNDTQREEFSQLFESIVIESESSLEPHLGREDMLKLPTFISWLAAHSSATDAKVARLMKTICTLGFHVFAKDAIAKRMKELNDRPTTEEDIEITFDWKENMQRGRGPIEDKNAVFQQQPTAVFGICITYFNRKWIKRGEINMAIMSNVLDKTAAAAIAFLEFFIAEMMKEPWFKEVWDKVLKVHWRSDIGPHFLSEGFLGWLLLVFPRKYMKMSEGQLKIGSHGKDKVDAKPLGQPGVGGAMNAILKKERLLTTEQFVKFNIERKKGHQLGFTEEKKDLNVWRFLFMPPPRFISSMIAIEQKDMKATMCWEARHRWSTGAKKLLFIDVYRHGVIHRSDTPVMRNMTSSRKALKHNEYRIKKVANVCHKNGVRSAWRLAAHEVETTAPINEWSLEKRRLFCIELKNCASVPLSKIFNQPAAKKQKRDGRCNERCTGDVTTRWNERMHFTEPYIANLDGADITAEMKAHKLATCGTKKEKMALLWKHIQDVKHQEETRTTRSTRADITSFFCNKSAELQAELTIKPKTQSSSSSSSSSSSTMSSSL